MFRKRLQIGLLHAAVAMTAVPVDSTLNRLLINELGVAAVVVAMMVTLPYLFSPVQIAIGAFADRNPVFGRRRTPYILFGLVLCALGVGLAPGAVYLIPEQPVVGILAAFGAFGLWGMGFNFAAVSYFSLASELSGNTTGRTVSVMYFMLIVTVIATGITVGRLIEPFSVQALQRTVWGLAGVALLMGIVGLIGLEPRSERLVADSSQPRPRALLGLLADNPQVRLFFVYLVILLAAILGQDVLLEPYAAAAFDMSPGATTRLTSIYGSAFLVALVLAWFLEKRLTHKQVAAWSGALGVAAFALVALSGPLGAAGAFYAGVVLIGLAIGLSTVANHALMFLMTTPANVGLFIGAWGMATAVSRLVGSVVGGALRDAIAQVSGTPLPGYVAVFLIEAGFIAVSLILLRGIDLDRFHAGADGSPIEPLSVLERAAAAD